MFRRYEDPHKVQEMLEKAERELERVKAVSIEGNTDYYIDMVNEVESLEESGKHCVDSSCQGILRNLGRKR